MGVFWMEKRSKQTILRIILNSGWLKKNMENSLSSFVWCNKTTFLSGSFSQYPLSVTKEQILIFFCCSKLTKYIELVSSSKNNNT